jgi:hypothetical protein
MNKNTRPKKKDDALDDFFDDSEEVNESQQIKKD